MKKIIFSVLIVVLAIFAFRQTFHGGDWQKLSAKSKAEKIWSVLSENENSQSWPSVWELANLFIESMLTSFDTIADDMPYQYAGLSRRQKLIHSVGAIAPCQFVVNSNSTTVLNYTGIFQTGASYAFCRFSLATQPEVGTARTFVPAFSFKIMRDGVPSTNLFAMYSLMGQDSWNFFKHDLTNHVPDISTEDAAFALKELKKAFLTASKWPTFIGLNDIAQYDQNGRVYSNLSFPFRLVFHPNPVYHFKFSDDYPNENLQQQLNKNLKPGLLYTVYAEINPGRELVNIGQINLMAPPTASMFGDRYLFFQHVRMEPDMALHPEWVDPSLALLKEQEASSYWTFPDLPWN